ncbi:MAG: nucleoside recognition domain-containing protein [Christensenellales bacterium]|jgi:spore maturation protein A
MINYIWAFLIVVGTLTGIATGRAQEVSDAAINGAKDAALLCVSLIGAYALWLGVLNIAKDAGLVTAIARRMRGIIRRLFTDVPSDSAASGYITLNIVANMLGMGNAATPFGLKAMKELQDLNPKKDKATHSMCMLLIINASSVQLLPLTVIALRSAAGSAAPAEIVLTALLATTVTTAVGITAGKILQGVKKCR